VSPRSGLDLSRSDTWSAGTTLHGTPNAGDGGTFPGTDPDGDDNGDGLSNFAHHALAGAGPLRLPEIETAAGGPRLIAWRTPSADDAVVTIEASAAPDDGWEPLADGVLLESTVAGGVIRETWQIPNEGSHRFLRLKIVGTGGDSF